MKQNFHYWLGLADPANVPSIEWNLWTYNKYLYQYWIKYVCIFFCKILMQIIKEKFLKFLSLLWKLLG